ncbi:CGNR zinc finger domain-containing protein [Nocardiopsis composta]|uniref:Putative RNA-binding Zn ribbon-like protein n=1 Tax=Nocardiopsis composta TaxID=157465 RepID=A0A7W8QIB9_9ACTN|nr:CGNR zinc finger domain-containing protein [Nocardiopsis composta]MBB5430499.1 putative RNA-binding Zn ribbon-like protein [Nocardiopsis composta]
MAYDRPPAPEDLEPVESFCDSARFLYGEDSFADVASARSWLRDHGHAAAADALDRAGLGVLAEVREAVRGHLEGDAGARRRLTAAAADLLGSPRWEEDGALVHPVAAADPVRALAGSVLAALAAAEPSGRRARLKVCRSPECRWVFYDRSPANNASWCSMDICGARHKMRTYRSRRGTARTGD